jgi:hypothetical protein
MATLERLEAKYRLAVFQTSDEKSERTNPPMVESEPVSSAEIPVQASLF